MLALGTYRHVKYWAWHCVTSCIDHMIQIYVGQKDKVNQWKVEEFLYTVLLYQAVTVRIINILAVL